MSNEIQRLKNLANSGIGESDADLLRSIANRLDSDAKRDAQYDALQEIGKTAYASIVEMVAALDCDYDRLEELAGERADFMKEFLAENPGSGLDDAPPMDDELKELLEAAGECESRNDAEQRIQEDTLSVEVRSDWHDVESAGTVYSPCEFNILLSTGGPATRIIGELDEHGEPTRARLQAQDWGTSWEDVRFQDGMDETLLTYCRCFYFGEG